MILRALVKSWLRPGKHLLPWFVASFAVLFVSWTALLVFVLPRYRELEFMRLHYTAQYGVDWVGPWQSAFTFPLLGLALILANLYLVAVLDQRFRGLAVLVAEATLLFEIVIAGAVGLAIFLNL